MAKCKQLTALLFKGLNVTFMAIIQSFFPVSLWCYNRCVKICASNQSSVSISITLSIMHTYCPLYHSSMSILTDCAVLSLGPGVVLNSSFLSLAPNLVSCFFR